MLGLIGVSCFCLGEPRDPQAPVADLRARIMGPLGIFGPSEGAPINPVIRLLRGGLNWDSAGSLLATKVALNEGLRVPERCYLRSLKPKHPMI